MVNKTLLYTGVCVTISVLIVFTLANYVKRRPNSSGGFIRKFRKEALTSQGHFDLLYNSYYLAGTTDENIYLGNSVATAILFKTNYNFTDTATLRIKVPQDISWDWRAVTIRVDYPFLYMMEGIEPEILSAKLPSLQAQRLRIEKTYFQTAIPLSGTSFILKVYDTRLQQFVITKKKTGIPYDSYATSEILEKQGEGRFSVAGLLTYDSKSGRMVYVYSYRNKIIALDTGLNILYRNETIDTVSGTQIKVAELNSGTEFTLAGQSVVVNRKVCISDELIFINSGLKADNEDEKVFRSAAVIDVYTIKDGRYQFSFYLHNHKQNKLRSMLVHNDVLMAIFGQYIFTYKLNF